jgi:hypothetical protein
MVRGRVPIEAGIACSIEVITLAFPICAVRPPRSSALLRTGKSSVQHRGHCGTSVSSVQPSSARAALFRCKTTTVTCLGPNIEAICSRSRAKLRFPGEIRKRPHRSTKCHCALHHIDFLVIDIPHKQLCHYWSSLKFLLRLRARCDNLAGNGINHPSDRPTKSRPRVPPGAHPALDVTAACCGAGRDPAQIELPLVH